ncbi:hypothetical protein RJT34_10224 [Clitoria ternatea]|uniref:Uncharacterized protein n=1 Tax=Clitoria ternatea TaxID=43366 RepID=A0AAN9K878_CLITE
MPPRKRKATEPQKPSSSTSRVTRSAVRLTRSAARRASEAGASVRFFTEAPPFRRRNNPPRRRDHPPPNPEPNPEPEPNPNPISEPNPEPNPNPNPEPNPNPNPEPNPNPNPEPNPNPNLIIVIEHCATETEVLIFCIWNCMFSLPSTQDDSFGARATEAKEGLESRAPNVTVKVNPKRKMKPPFQAMVDLDIDQVITDIIESVNEEENNP